MLLARAAGDRHAGELEQLRHDVMVPPAAAGCITTEPGSDSALVGEQRALDLELGLVHRAQGLLARNAVDREVRRSLEVTNDPVGRLAEAPVDDQVVTEQVHVFLQLPYVGAVVTGVIRRQTVALVHDRNRNGVCRRGALVVARMARSARMARTKPELPRARRPRRPALLPLQRAGRGVLCRWRRLGGQAGVTQSVPGAGGELVRAVETVAGVGLVV